MQTCDAVQVGRRRVRGEGDVILVDLSHEALIVIIIVVVIVVLVVLVFSFKFLSACI